MRTPITGEFEGGSVFIDGDWRPLSEAKVSMFDWGFTRSDVGYDVATTWQGAFFRLDDHLDRFFASLDKLRMTIPYDRAGVRRILHGCVRAGGIRDGYVAMLCTRGVPPRGARDPRLAENRFYAYALPYVWIADPEKQARGIDLHVSDRVRISPDSVDPKVKNYHWLDLVMSLFDAYDRGADTSCVVDAAGNVTEGPGFNVFMVKDGVVRTADRGVLEGISRKTAIELCGTLGIALRVEPVPAADLAAADEVFITSSGGGVLPIAKVDGQPVGRGFPGPVTKRLQDAYWALHDDPRHRDPVEY
ncbi:MAG TPA: aminotransferase class IV [Caldimonas sp.]|nr:aminotransferase class IV [Caldimonas sp.]